LSGSRLELRPELILGTTNNRRAAVLCFRVSASRSWSPSDTEPARHKLRRSEHDGIRRSCLRTVRSALAGSHLRRSYFRIPTSPQIESIQPVAEPGIAFHFRAAALWIRSPKDASRDGRFIMRSPTDGSNQETKLRDRLALYRFI